MTISKTAQFLYLISSWNLLILPQIEQGCVQFWWTIILNWRLKLKYCVVLELGGTSTLQAAWRAEVPPLRTLKWGDFRFPGMAAWKVEDPPLPQFAICYLLTLGSTSIQHSVFIYSVLNCQLLQLSKLPLHMFIFPDKFVSWHIATSQWTIKF